MNKDVEDFCRLQAAIKTMTIPVDLERAVRALLVHYSDDHLVLYGEFLTWVVRHEQARENVNDLMPNGDSNG